MARQAGSGAPGRFRRALSTRRGRPREGPGQRPADANPPCGPRCFRRPNVSPGGILGRAGGPVQRGGVDAPAPWPRAPARFAATCTPPPHSPGHPATVHTHVDHRHGAAHLGMLAARCGASTGFLGPAFPVDRGTAGSLERRNGQACALCCKDFAGSRTRATIMPSNATDAARAKGCANAAAALTAPSVSPSAAMLMAKPA